MTLAYVFWHWPAEPSGYEEGMQAFHTALGWRDTATFRLERAPFDADSAPYEDWYPAPDWTAIGELNHFAVSGAAKGPHDAVAAMSRRGAGAIYERVWGELPLHDVTFAAWSPRRPEPQKWHAAIWRRQLVLGPAPEYAVLADSPVDVDAGAIVTAPRLVARS